MHLPAIALAALADPARRRLYEFVLHSCAPVSRDEAAEAVRCKRGIAAFHLDKLVDAGLLRATFSRPPGRTGPGSGRPTKRYEVAGEQSPVTVPPRRYDLLAEILLDSNGTASGGEIDAARRHGRKAGQRNIAAGSLGGEVSLDAVLDAEGFAATRDRNESVLTACPFHALVDQDSERVCAMNVAFMEGLLDGAGLSGSQCAILEPGAGRCCVRFVPRPRA